MADNSPCKLLRRSKLNGNRQPHSLAKPETGRRQHPSGLSFGVGRPPRRDDFAFLELKPQMPAAALPGKLECGLEFRHVSFRYPDREEYALRDVSLTIKPVEKIALVGANGAGKTTFVKLLTRLYDPSEGEVLIDGIDLREVDPKDLQKRIGVIFQDFVKYSNQLFAARPSAYRMPLLCGLSLSHGFSGIPSSAAYPQMSGYSTPLL